MLGLKNLNFFYFHKNLSEIDQRSQFEQKKKNVTKIYLAVDILSRYLLIVKKYFQTHKLTLSFVRPQTTDSFSLLLGDIKRHIKENIKRYFHQ